MKGIILAGGNGSRLFPLTKSFSKHFLPVFDKPMIYYPLSTLMLSNIREILIICTQRDLSLFKTLLGDGSKLGLHFEYAIQNEPKGIADAFIIGEEFIGTDDVCLVLGDNIFFGQNFTGYLNKAKKRLEDEKGAYIFGYYMKEAGSYGVLCFDKNGKIEDIEEKPELPKSNYVVPGIYFFDNEVCKIAKKLTPSSRGEIEIVDLQKQYLKDGRLNVELFGRGLAWFDTGTFDGLLEASNFISILQKRQGFFVGCIEEIAFRNGWISKQQLLECAATLNSSYGEYLEFLCGEKNL
ncbi:MAG: glucose-1-phosphate thymidylyltransferase RfbA [Treponema sp.]|nr:glucose-1-phosphate thymidylyltransferase RfbA [Treponema sp.]